MPPKKIMTPIGEISVQKGHQGSTSPSEEAAVILMGAAGVNSREIALSLDRGRQWVLNHIRDLQQEIEDMRLQLREPLLEDYTDILMMTMQEHKVRLLDPEKRASISDKDLTGMARHFFNMRQIVNEEPTQITQAKEAQVVNILAVAQQTDENFEAAMRAIIERKGEELNALPLIEGEVIETDGNGDGLCADQ